MERQIISYLINNPEESIKIDENIFLNADIKKIFSCIKNRIIEKKATDIEAINIETKIPLNVLMSYSSVHISIKAFQEILELTQKNHKNYIFESLVNSVNWQSLSVEEKYQDIIRIKEEIQKIETSKNSNVISNPDLITQFLEDYDKPVVAVKTGIGILDSITGGLRAGEFITILANSGVGKTNLMLNMASNMLDAGKSVLYFSLEMGANELLGRLYGINAGINAFALREKSIPKDELFSASQRLIEKKLTICSTAGLTSSDVVGIIMEQKADIVMIDYLQRLNDGKGRDSEAERLTQMCRRLKNAAMNLGVPIITPSQVDKESAKGKYIGIENATGSKSIGDESDLSLYLFKQTESNRSGLNEKEEMFLKVCKNRHGQTGDKIKVYFDVNNLKLKIDY